MFTHIIDPRNKNSYSISSKKGKDLLKLYIKNFNGGLQEVTQKKNKYEHCCDNLWGDVNENLSAQEQRKIQNMVHNCKNKKHFLPIGFKKKIRNRIKSYNECKKISDQV